MRALINSFPFRPCHVLIIEDNEDGRDSLRLLLEQLGCRVAVAGDGFEGVRKALAEHPSLALIDLQLPALDGYEVAALLRDALDGTILLVAYTVLDDQDTGNRLAQAGFDGLIVKPVRLPELTAWLERASALTD